MKIFLYLLLFSSIVSNAYANKGIRYDLLRNAAAKMIKVPAFTERMAWEYGGVVIDEFVEYLSVHELRVYSSYSDHGLRAQLGKILNKELNGDIFSLDIIGVNKRIVRKYFLGEEPDLKAIISRVIAAPELRAKMEWGNEGLTVNEIMAAVIKRYPDIHILYMQAPHNENGLHRALMKVLNEGLNGDVFSLRVKVDSKYVVHKYFLGEEPNLKAIISEVIAVPEFRVKMEWGNEGLIMDEIMAAVIKRYPDVHTLYAHALQNKTDLKLRLALMKVLNEKLNSYVFSLQVKVGGKYLARKYFLGEAPNLKAIIFEVITVPEFRVKMEWGNEGLTMDEIMAAVIKSYPDVHTLYAHTPYNEHGLRVTLMKVIGGMNGIVSRRVSVSERRYFWKK